MQLRVTKCIERNQVSQVFLSIRFERAAPANVMDLETLRSSAILASPAIPFEHGLAKRLVNAVNKHDRNGFVRLPDKAVWLGDFLHELASFPAGKYDDQADSTSQALQWFRQSVSGEFTLLEYFKREAARIVAEESAAPKPIRFTRADALREWDRTRFSRGF